MLGLCAAALLVVATAFFLLTGTQSQVAEADTGKTTEATAAAAGARVLPTDPKLKIEPR